MNTVRERDFRELMVWEKAHGLTLECYRLTGSVSREEQYGLTSQIRRAAVSVPANIAEGCGRGGNELSRFCRIAFGSLSELQYHLILAHDLGLFDQSMYVPLERKVVELRRMLSSFITHVSSGQPARENSTDVTG